MSGLRTITWSREGAIWPCRAIGIAVGSHRSWHATLLSTAAAAATAAALLPPLHPSRRRSTLLSCPRNVAVPELRQLHPGFACRAPQACHGGWTPLTAWPALTSPLLALQGPQEAAVLPVVAESRLNHYILLAETQQPFQLCPAGTPRSAPTAGSRWWWPRTS